MNYFGEFNDFYDNFDVPSGDDVTDLFAAAGQDMEPEEVILMDGFGLADAMSVFEIGEPRLDSGMSLEEQPRPPFNPLTPLLPEEICWILDRSFACEMEWHSGKTLSQSVFTILFVHHMPDINPEYLPPEEKEDPARPLWLITVVLRAGMLGLLKCCDLAWRELSKNRVHDVEDWNGEKCDVSMLESINTNLIVHMLDSACDWLRRSSLPDQHVRALCDRLLLRKTLLQLYRQELLKGVEDLPYYLAMARGLLHHVRTSQQNDLPLDSPARLAMDPHIARRLPNYMPMRVAELPDFEKIWDSLEAYIEFWAEIGRLVTTPSLFKWEAAGAVRIGLNKSTPASYHRSLVQTSFYDSGVILGTHRMSWLVDQFFYETIGVPYHDIFRAFERSAPPIQMASMRDIIERRIHKLLIPHIRSSWFNPPRRRRHLMREILQWHMLYDVMLKEVSQHRPTDAETKAILTAAPLAVKLWRLAACRELILSGFQQELYAPDERPIAYWRLSSVLEVHLACIEDLLPIVPRHTPAFRELTYQSRHLTALQMIASALTIVTSKMVVLPWQTLSLQYWRRYKWLIKEEFDNLIPLDPNPDFEPFQNVLDDLAQDTFFSPPQTLRLARDILSNLSESSEDWVGHWAEDRRQYLRNLTQACDRLERHVPGSVLELPNFNTRQLRWIVAVHPWIPTVDEP